MDLFVGIAPLRAALDYHLERHNVLSSNIAHVDTPGYVPRDLARIPANDFASALHVAVTATQPLHMAAGSLTPTTGRVFQDRWEGGGKDGNFVSLDREAGKLAANQLRYDVTSAIITAEFADLAFAASDGRTG
ncbi:MAG: flagellar basal body rod protein FlgB [Deltaproteobacteria bacterium]|nr:flagellar basal body rod protein FlgB [Deltaproteobacteria bacterium]